MHIANGVNYKLASRHAEIGVGVLGGAVLVRCRIALLREFVVWSEWYLCVSVCLVFVTASLCN